MPYQGEQIFVFTAGEQSAREHLNDTIRQPLDLDRVLSLFPAGQHAQIQEFHQDQGLYAWGAIPGVQNTPRWESMKSGDWVLCVYDGTYHYVARVLAKFNNEIFARAIWGDDPQGRTWRLMYFLSKPIAIKVSVGDVADYLNQSYMGFFRIGEEKHNTIIDTYGSIEAFIEQRLFQADETAGSHPFDAITRDDVLEALRRIDEGQMFGFGESTDYDLLHEGKRYPPKAVAGIATIRTLGRAMRPDEFSAGLKSKNFKVLEKLGFEVVPKESKALDLYLLIRSNPDSPYKDELGTQYHFSSNVPNQKKLMSGANVVIDSKTSNGVKLLGYGVVGPSKQVSEKEGVREFVAPFLSWTQFSPPRDLTPEMLSQVQAQPGYNVQHAMRPISKQVYEFLIGEVPFPRHASELCLLGTWKASAEVYEALMQTMTTQDGYASWWSFGLKPGALEHFRFPGHMYLNKGGGRFPYRFQIEEIITTTGNEGIVSPWPDITPPEDRGRTRRGDKQSEVFKTWLRVSSVERLSPELTLKDFVPAVPWSNDTNILNQNSFGYAYRKENAVCDPAVPYTMHDAMDGLFMDEEEFRKILSLFEAKKNLILQGAPGTGKTFIAKRLAYSLMEEQAKDRVKMVQFHQSYAYEDFMGGYRPVENSHGGGFAFRKGLFYRFCDEAKQCPEKKFVFVIDEINRGNLSKIFGEIMMLVESDKRGAAWGIPLTYSKEGDEPFCVPENVYILGLMNTADRSLAMVDYALRRRFAFWTLRPAFGSDRLSSYLLSCGLSADMVKKIFSRMNTLNKEIEADRDLGRGFLIGHSFFCSPAVQGGEEVWYERVIESEMEPLLREYWFDKREEDIKSRIAQLLI